MTIPLPQLKQVKNAVIGNPSKKAEIARDEGFVRTLVQCLNPPPPHTPTTTQTRIEAANVLASLAYGSDTSLASLLHAQTHQALLVALFWLQPTDPPTLSLALGRALRAVICSAADVVGPSLWGIRVPRLKGVGMGRAGRGERDEEERRIRILSGEAIDSIYHLESLDTLLSRLSSPSPSPLLAPLLHLFACTTRSSIHRTAVTSWSLPAERIKEVRARRGWEVAPHGPGWVVKRLVGIIRESRDISALEGALGLLGTLGKEVGVAAWLFKSDREGQAPAETILHLAKHRNVDVQLAASLCLTHIVRASLTTPPPPAPIQALEDICIRGVINIVDGIVSATGSSDERKKRGCFILHYLSTDHPQISLTIHTQGCVERITELVKNITPQEAEAEEEMWENESAGVVELREAALTALATLSLHDNSPRLYLTGSSSPPIPSSSPASHSILNTLTVSLTHPHPGVRYAACQCARALSRSVQVLRTSTMDSGLGLRVWEVVKTESRGLSSATPGEDGVRGEGEEKVGREGDKRVLNAALSVMCNLANGFSPAREALLSQDFVPSLMQIYHRAPEESIRVNCLWAIKNLVRESTTEQKREWMSVVGWGFVASLLTDSDTGIQEQAFSLLRNLSENEEGVELVLEEIGTEVVLDRITAVLGGSDEDVILQATALLANITNNDDAKENILTHPRLLSALRSSIADAKSDTRKAAVMALRELAENSPSEGRRRMMDAGLGSTLRHLCEWSNAGVAISGSPTTSSPIRSGTGGRRNSSAVRAPGMARSVSGGAGPGIAHPIHSIHPPSHAAVNSGVQNWRAGGANSGAHHGHGHGIVGAHGHGHGHYHPPSQDDSDIVGIARRALDMLEHGDSYDEL